MKWKSTCDFGFFLCLYIVNIPICCRSVPGPPSGTSWWQKATQRKYDHIKTFQSIIICSALKLEEYAAEKKEENLWEAKNVEPLRRYEQSLKCRTE